MLQTHLNTSRVWLLLALLGLSLGTSAMGTSPMAVVPNKLALIITIGDYPAPSIYGYGTINAGNDAPLVKSALMSQGFAAENILMLADDQATLSGIVDAFRQLTAQAAAGDVIVVHYSGHGHQITDDNGDELDGYDEVLVPYGAPNFDAIDLPDGYAGEKHLRDDHLDLLLTELREKLGPEGQLLMTIDACFSGSATRFSPPLPVRGITTPFGPPSVQRGSSGELTEQRSTTTRGGNIQALAPMVVISATDFNQLDQEVWGPGQKAVGPLSLALSRTMPALRPGVSHAAWFEQIRLAMAAIVPNQTPQIEGAVTTAVIGGQVAEGRGFFRVQQVLDDTVAVVEAGTLAGIQPGVSVSFFALEAGPDEPAVNSGVVTDVDELVADVRLLRPDTAGRLQESRAFVSEFSFGTLDVSVSLQEITNDDQHRRVSALLDSIPNAVQVEQQSDVSFDSDGAGFVLRTSADGLALGGPFDLAVEDDLGEIRDLISSYGRNRFLTQLEMRDPEIDVRVDIVPATHRITRRGCVASDTTTYGAEKTAAGWLFHRDDGYLLRLRNVGNDPAYVAVLEFTPTGLSQLFPNPALRVSDNLLAPGASYLVEDLCFQADEPYGDYVIKLFATRDKLDFGPIVEAAGETRGSQPKSYLEQLLVDAYRGTRSGVTGRALGTGSTHATIVRVVQ
jgi:hypothetical protein